MGPVQPGYESGDTDAMLNAFERDTHRALVDWVGDRELWPGWFGQGMHAMPPGLKGFPAFEADRTRWVLQRPGGKERLAAATERRMQRHADPAGARRLAKERPVITASDLIRDRAERRRLEQTAEVGGRRKRSKSLSAATSSQLSQLTATERPPLLRPSADLVDEDKIIDGMGKVWVSIGAGPPGEPVGGKRKPGKKTTARQRKRQKAQDMLLEDSPDRPASRPTGEGKGEVPPVVYEPEDPMDVG